ncbi:MAG: SRPBCC domain-containing protein [Capsulimonadaceae bacterium]|nr:SRPBCC domain-containing protein [Capsulimonadaceae bacterium]
MTEPTTNSTPGTEPRISVSRTFAAPRDIVFKAWTESERLSRWWGAAGFSMLVAKLDVRPGGVFHYGMRSPDGLQMWGKFTYAEVAPPERLVFRNSFADEAGNPVRHPFCPTWPLEVLTTLTLVEHDGVTDLALSGSPINANELEIETFGDGIASMEQGFSGTFDQLAEYLANP